MKNKRILAAMLALSIASSLTLTGCGDKKTENPPAGDEQVDSNEQTENGEEGSKEKDKEKDEEIIESVSFSSDSGIYAEEISLSLSSEDDGDIYYTLDGSDPKSSDTAIKYEAEFVVSDRSGESNIVSSIDPVLFSGNFNSVVSISRKEKDFACDKTAPSDDAVDKLTTVRAVVKKSDGSYSVESSAAYFFGTMEEHVKGIAESVEAAGMDLAVISIQGNYDDFFSADKGIYMKGDIFKDALADHIDSGERVDSETARRLSANYNQKGREWEREVRMDFFEANSEGLTEVISQNCGIRIQGNYSRSDLFKGFRLYARKDYGKKSFKHNVFGDGLVDDEGEVIDTFKTLTLRNGGNCAFTAKFNDTFWQSLIDDLDVETQHSRPCVVYLNGEYWGLYVLQEDYSDKYFSTHHGVDKDNVIVYKGDAEALALGYKLDIGDLPEGESDERYYFDDLLTFFRNHKDCVSDEDYEELAALVDPESCRDYFAVESWINNKWDWPGKNWSMWKTATDEGTTYGDGRWRFMVYDVEFGGVSGSGDANTNTIKEDNYKTLGLLDMDTNNPAVLCFAYFMTNETFRKDFETKLYELSDTCFEQSAAFERLDYFEAVYGPLYEQFFERYPETGSADDALYGGYASAKCIEDFLNKRVNNIGKMVDWVEKKLGNN